MAGPNSVRRSTSAPLLPRAPTASEELMRALSAPDLRQAASAYAQELGKKAAPAAAGADALEGAEAHENLDESIRAARGELRWQAFSGNVVPDTAVAAALSPARLAVDQVEVGNASGALIADRASLAGSATAGDNSLGLTQNPLFTRATVAHAFHGSAAATAGASLWAGGKIKGAGLSATMTPSGLGQTIGFGAGLTTVSDNSIEVLGHQRIAADGSLQHLTRLKSEFLPVLEISASTAAAQVSIGGRLTAFAGHSGTMEKYVETDKLAAMLRQRDVWYRPALQTVAALGVKVGLKLPSAGKLADDLVRGAGLAEGESYQFTRQKGLTFGVSAGAAGVKATVNVLTQSGTTMALHRTGPTTYQLAVTPSQAKAVSAGIDASVAAEAFVTLSRALVQRQVWSFDTSLPTAKDALAAALRGTMPGVINAAATIDAEGLQALSDRQRVEDLPPGVKGVSSELGLHTELSGGVAALRPLASTGITAGLAATRAGFDVVHGLATAEGTALNLTTGSRRGVEKLLGGARSESISATVHQQASGGASPAFDGLSIDVDLELRSGRGTSRQAIVDRAAQLSDKALGSNSKARRSDHYQVQGHWALVERDLELLAQVPASAVADAAERAGLAPLHLRALIAELQAAPIADGSPRYLTMASAVAQFVRRGRSPAVVALRAMLGAGASASMAFTAKNARHERTLAKFLAADAMQRGARTAQDLHKVASRMKSLTQRLERQIQELEGDALLGGLLPESRAEQVDLLGAVKDSTVSAYQALVDGLNKRR